MRFLACLIGITLALSSYGAELHFNFSDYSEGTTPTNFHTALLGGGIPPNWQILGAEVPSGFMSMDGKTPLMSHSTVLAQTSEDKTDERYPMFIYDGNTYADFNFSTRFKAVSGEVEKMAGVVFRYQNSSNFYVVRVSVLGKNIAFYKVIDGQIASPFAWPLEIKADTWHTLEVDCSGTYINCLVDGKRATQTITDKKPLPGKIGFWTKSDAVTYFADAKVNFTPQIQPAQQLINDMVQKRPMLLGLDIYVLNGTNATQVLASKNPADKGKSGSNVELQAILNGTAGIGWEREAVLITLPLHDRNGEYIAAVRVKMKRFFGETQDSAVTRAEMVIHDMEQTGISAEGLRNQ